MFHRFFPLLSVLVVSGLAHGQYAGLGPVDSLNEHGNIVVVKPVVLPQSPHLNTDERIIGLTPPLGGTQSKLGNMPWHSRRHRLKKKKIYRDRGYGKKWHRKYEDDSPYNIYKKYRTQEK